ncbi:suppressor of cytokine signaling 1-like [Mugil cephalus]|uniref:suppressor of cytokine signaling 1-like n=1 Tax=Mugil cephalus TaxID=48193 RepID=UPI001FB60E5B|nr:suppressor of cytokine signaling 1-like [Mugil cephalus]
MVRDSLDRTVALSQTQSCTTETQEAAGSERAQSPEQVDPESTEPTERQLDLQFWSKLKREKGSESWGQAGNGANADNFPTHLRPFSSQAEYELVKHTYQQLQHSGFYWGPMAMEEAHDILSRAPLGTFLIRDSGQTDVFFTLSYQSEDGPTSVRIQLNNLHFSLYGSNRTFESLFALLTYYTSSACKLTVPYRRQRPERLKQMCRRAFVRAYGAENISTVPEHSPQIRVYINAYPYCI